MQPTPLNSDQEQALDCLMQFITKSKERFFVLEGPAGVGKTFLVNYLNKEISHYYNAVQFLTGDPSKSPPAFMPTATTNPAAEKLLIADTPATTVHSFLELTVWSDYATGQTSLLPRPRSDGPIHEPYLIIVDEASYLNDEMLGYLHSRTHPESKIIMMGDACQLTSPKTNMAPAFTKGYPEFSLNTQVRQDPDSHLGRLCLNFRQAVITGEIPPFDLVPGQIEHFSDPNQFLGFVSHKMTQLDYVPTQSRILAWRNKTVTAYNNHIVSQLRGEPIPYSGQYALSNRPVMVKNRVVVPNNGQVLIKSVTPTTDCGFPGYRISYFSKNALYEGFAPVDHVYLTQAKRKGLQESDVRLVKKAMDEWLDFRPAFASTIDKAQGSTYDEVFINLSDIAACRNYNRVLRMLYTGTSRAKHTVYFLGDLNG